MPPALCFATMRKTKTGDAPPLGASPACGIQRHFAFWPMRFSVPLSRRWMLVR